MLVHLAPPKEVGWTTNPLLGICIKNHPVSGQTFYCQVFASHSGRSHSEHWFLEKVQHHCCSRDQPNPACLYSDGPAYRQTFICPILCRFLSCLFLFCRQPSPLPCSPFLILCLQTWSVFLKISPPSCARVMWCPHQPMEWSVTFTQVATPQFLQNPVALIQKSLRPCGDYCHLNLVTTSDKYPLPNI